jgi:nitroreductase
MADTTNIAGLGAERIAALREAIAHRRSLGLARLRPDPVDREILEAMLEAANWAPSNDDTEPWRFTVFTGEGRNRLADIFGEAYRRDAGDDFREDHYQAHRDRAFAAPVWISLGVAPALDDAGNLLTSVQEEAMAAACAVQNLHLVAAAYGLAGMWHSKGSSVHPVVAEQLGLAAPNQLLGFFYCGWPNVNWPAGKRRPLSQKVNWVE